MNIIGYNVFEYYTSVHTDDYVIAPAKYKFNQITKSLNALKKSLLDTKVTEKDVEHFKKVGKIVDILSFARYKYDVNYGTTVTINPDDMLHVLVIDCGRKKLKYLEAYPMSCEKQTYGNCNDTKVTFFRGAEHDVKHDYCEFSLYTEKINQKEAGLYVDRHHIPHAVGYCFSGTIIIPYHNSKLIKEINDIYNPNKKYMPKNCIEYDFGNRKQYYKLDFLEFESEYHKEKLNVAKDVLYNYIKDYFNKIEKYKEECLMALK